MLMAVLPVERFGRARLALAGFEARVRLVDDIDAPLAPNDLAVRMALFERFQGRADFHVCACFVRFGGARETVLVELPHARKKAAEETRAAGAVNTKTAPPPFFKLSPPCAGGFLRPVFSALRDLADRFAKFTEAVIYDRVPSESERDGWLPGERLPERRLPLLPLLTRAYGAFLKALSVPFGLCARARLALYRQRILRDTPLGCKVVVVGNLTVGGTGKTPVTEKLARVLAERGRRVAILSRGYKSRSEPRWRRFWRWLTHGERPAPRVVSDGRQLCLDSEQAGDEPFMLARNLLPLRVAVVVNRDRVQAGEFAIERFGCDTILLDDGLQYLPLRGQINLLLVDSTNPFGNGWMLPGGILREPVANLSRGHYILITKCAAGGAPELRARILALNPSAKIIECAHVPRNLSALDGLTVLPLDYLRGRRVATFSGIATPERFEEFLERAGARIIHRRRFRDHHRFSEDDLVDVFDEASARDAEFVVTTEKDAVRIDAERKWRLPLFYLRLEIEIVSGGDVFEGAVDRICEGLAAG